MGKGMYLGVDSKAHKVKKAYIGVDGKARKIKKVYIGDANGKARLCWSSNLGLFLFSKGYLAYTSSDGISYENTGIDRPKAFDNIVYALDKFWSANISSSSAEIYNSSDGVNWTLVATLNSNNYFSKGVFAYQNGVFIIIGGYTTTTKKNMAYSTDGVTWNSVHISLNDAYKYTSPAIDLRYGTVGGVAGWYVFAKSAVTTTSVSLYRFNSLNDIKNGTLTYLASHSIGDVKTTGALCIRNNKAYMLSYYYTGDISDKTYNKVFLSCYNGTSFTVIATEVGVVLGTVWSTDKYLIYRGVNYSETSSTLLAPRYNFETETYSRDTVSNGFGQDQNTIDAGVFVGSRMYQVMVVKASDKYVLQGAYSDNYGETVTKFVVDEEYSGSTGYATLLVYGDEGSGFYQEQY